MANPAPHDLALIEDFVNTFDLETGEEELGSPEALTAWTEGARARRRAPRP